MVAVARQTSDLVVATTGGVICWRVTEGRVVPVMPVGPGSVVGLATDPRGEVIYMLNANRNGFLLRCFAADGSGSFALTSEVRETVESDGGSAWYLQPAASIRDGNPRVTVAGPHERVTFVGRYLQGHPAEAFQTDGRNTHLLVEAGAYAWDWDDRFVRCLGDKSGDPVIARWVPHWTPAAPVDTLPASPHVDWHTPEPGVLEVAGTDRDGHVCWSEFDARDPDQRPPRTATASHPDGYRSVCIVGRGAVAAVTNTMRSLAP